MYLTEQKKQALELYVNQSYTQQQIADSLGVCVRTVFNWIKQHAWDRLRLATHQAPALIADNFSSQLVELQNEIAAREPGKRYPNTQEMEIMRKLTVCINNTKKTISLPQVTQMMRMFRGFVFDSRKKEDAVKVADAIDSFLEARSRFGYAPYDLEFGVEKIQSVDPIMNPYADISPKPEEKKKPNLATVRVDENGNKIYTVDTSHWSEKVRKIYEEHFGKLPEEDNTNTFPTDEKPLIINDLVTGTPETTGNKPANSATHESAIPATHEPAIPANPNPVQTAQTKAPLYPAHLNPYRSPSATTGNKPANSATTSNTENALVINNLSTESSVTTGNKPAIPATGKPINPDPTKPFTYQTSKYIITQFPDGSIRYDNRTTPAVTIKKGGPIKLERREFYFR